MLQYRISHLWLYTCVQFNGVSRCGQAWVFLMHHGCSSGLLGPPFPHHSLHNVMFNYPAHGCRFFLVYVHAVYAMLFQQIPLH
jgi:hypothetical protein